MLFFGHLGIGSKLVSPFTKGLSKKALFLGTLLPDLIDKPVYYGLSFITGKRGQELGLISGTRTFGHTALFLLALTAVALARRSRVLAAVCIGVATHLMLDSFQFRNLFHLTHTILLSDDTMRSALLWPIHQGRFPIMPFRNIQEHLSFWHRPGLLVCEGIGSLILLWDYRQEIFVRIRPKTQN